MEASLSGSRETLSARSLLIVKMGKGVTVATDFVTEDIPAWIAQRAFHTSWVICWVSTLTPPWTPAANRDISANQHLLTRGRSTWTPSVEVIHQMMRFIRSTFVGRSNLLPLVCSLASNSYEGESRFFSRNTIFLLTVDRYSEKRRHGRHSFRHWRSYFSLKYLVSWYIYWATWWISTSTPASSPAAYRDVATNHHC